MAPLVPCYHPIPAHQDSPGDDVKLWPPLGEANLDLPCGTCLGCRSSRATAWAKRCMDEAALWEHNCFVTLTYKPERLPPDGRLVPEDLQKFFKRLRRAVADRRPGLASDSGASVRYLSCGEYGETFGRPHYHALLFNLTFTDTVEVGKHLMESPALGKLWLDGGHKIGSLTGASANYVAQYTLKNIGKTQHTPDGEILPPPFFRMSLRPAIGKTHLLKYKTDYRHGYIIQDGKKAALPRAYVRFLKDADPELAEEISYNAFRAPRTQHNREAAERIHRAKRRLAAGPKSF